MPATSTKIIPTGTTNGQDVLIDVNTLATAKVIHTCTNNTSEVDEVWLYAYNLAAAAQDVYLAVGPIGEANPQRRTIPSRVEPYILCPGRSFNGGITVKVWGTTITAGNQILISAVVNRILNS